jgi:hypothetical protein
MKTTLLAGLGLVALLGGVGCSAPGEEEASSGEGAATGIPTVTTTQDVDVDMTQLRAPRCKILMGSFIAFEFQGRPFLGYAADDIGTCQKKLDDLLAVPLRHGTLKTERTGETAVWTLDLGDGFAFRADNVTPVNDPDVTSTILKSGALQIDLRYDVDSLKCQILQGSWIEFSFRGHSFMTYGADALPDCETRLAQFRSTPIHHGFLTRSESSDSVKWTLALDSVWEFSSYEKLQTSRAVTIDTAQDLTNVRCRHLKGLYMAFTYQGRDWLSLPPSGVANNCDAIEAAFEAQPTHSGQLVLRNEDGGIRHELLLNVPGSARGWEFLTWEAASE